MFEENKKRPNNIKKKSKSAGSLSEGLLLTFFLHIIGQLILYFLTNGISFFFIGVTQLIYIIPAIVITGSKEQLDTVKGLIIGAAITFLLNAACAGLLMNSMSFH